MKQLLSTQSFDHRNPSIQLKYFDFDNPSLLCLQI